LPIQNEKVLFVFGWENSLRWCEGDEDMRIAVLDDNVAIGEMLQHALELAGHTVVVYYSPSKFLAKIIEPTTASIPLTCLSSISSLKSLKKECQG
jgi:DNA-binding NtrC family response regulator